MDSDGPNFFKRGNNSLKKDIFFANLDPVSGSWTIVSKENGLNILYPEEAKPNITVYKGEIQNTKKVVSVDNSSFITFTKDHITAKLAVTDGKVRVTWDDFFANLVIAEFSHLQKLLFVVCNKFPKVLVTINVNAKLIDGVVFFDERIRSVMLMQHDVAVILPSSIRITDTLLKKQIYCLKFTSRIEERPLCMSSSLQSPYLAFVNYQDSGDVEIWDLKSCVSSNGKGEKKKVLQAHVHRISLLSMNIYGTRMASASDFATLVRVFSIPNGQLLIECRSGYRTIRILSLKFSWDASLLLVAHENYQINIFKLKEDSGTVSIGKEVVFDGNSLINCFSFIPYGPDVVRYASRYLPEAVQKFISQEFPFSSLNFAAGTDLRFTLALMHQKSSDPYQVVILTEDKCLNIYDVPKEGGSCVLRSTGYISLSESSN